MSRSNPSRSVADLAAVILRLSLIAVCAAMSSFTACSDGVVASSTALDSAFRIDASIGGTPVRLLLDTGTMRTTLSRAAAERLGLEIRHDRDVKVTDATGRVSETAGLARVRGLRIGATVYADLDAICHAFDARIGCDGIVGMDVLAVSGWDFDAAGGLVHMLPADGLETTLAAHGQRVVARAPLGGNELRPMVSVRLDEQCEVELLLDTGASQTSLPREIVAVLELGSGAALARRRADERAARWQAEFAEQGITGTVTVPAPDGTVVGIHGTAEKRSLYRLPQLELASRRFAELVVTDSARHGVLGRDVLGACRWLLHGPRRELWMLANRD